MLRQAQKQCPFSPRRALSLVLVIAGLSPTTCIASASAGKPQHLTCDSLEHPLGIDSLQPTFSWQLQDDGFAARQTAYRIEVATKPSLLSGKPDVWDSGHPDLINPLAWLTAVRS